MRILVIGQCTLHLGRLEFGNIGNYYIIEPLFRELHRVFPDAEIRTTFQMTDEFCKRENVVRLPMDLYYSWSERDLPIALQEVGAAHIFQVTGEVYFKSPYIDEVLLSDLVIDFSGDMWGDNAELAGENRFFVGLCKDYVPMLMGKKVVMLAGSPGPFSNTSTKSFAKKVYRGFEFVTTRDSLSRSLLQSEGFNVEKTFELACPSFLFDGLPRSEIEKIPEINRLFESKRSTIGFFICGWNFKRGPFNKWPRSDDEYESFVEAVEFVVKKIGARVCLASHSNGFKKNFNNFQLIHGRDYPIVRQLEEILRKRGLSDHVYLLNGIYSPSQMKAVIGQFDMVVSGRLHGAVAGLSQYVPTVIIDYGHEPKAHKLKGFAAQVGISHLVADPTDPEDLIAKIGLC